MSRWLLDFASADGIAGFVRLEVRDAERIAWFWTYLLGVPGTDGVLVVRDHEVLPPRQGLEIRAEGLWAELTCETPGEHWTFGLEAFGVRLDAATDALRAGGEIGDRLPVGLDLEWEVGANGPPAGSAHGDILVGRERFEIDGSGWFYDAATADPAPVDGERIAAVLIPIGIDAARDHLERRLVRTPGGRRWTTVASPAHGG